MDCSICDGHGDFVAHEYIMGPGYSHWRIMTRVPEHLKHLITFKEDPNYGDIPYKLCLCCDGTGKSKLK